MHAREVASHRGSKSRTDSMWSLLACFDGESLWRRRGNMQAAPTCKRQKQAPTWYQVATLRNRIPSDRRGWASACSFALGPACLCQACPTTVHRSVFTPWSCSMYIFAASASTLSLSPSLQNGYHPCALPPFPSILHTPVRRTHPCHSFALRRCSESAPTARRHRSGLATCLNNLRRSNTSNTGPCASCALLTSWDRGWYRLLHFVRHVLRRP